MAETPASPQTAPAEECFADLGDKIPALFMLHSDFN